MKQLFEALQREKLVIIARGIDTDALLASAEALCAVGVRFLEVTFDHRLQDPIADTAAKIRALDSATRGRMHIGAGTVLCAAEVRAAHDAGCRYIIAPNTNEEVIAETKRLGVLSIPGAMTPTEICRAWDLGADIVKLFPADDVGMHYIQNLKGPLPHIPLMATGGVSPATIPQLLGMGVACVATGVTVLRPDLVAARDYEGIAALARMHVDAVRLTPR